MAHNCYRALIYIQKLMGPSKNYVTAKGGEWVDDFVTYRYVYFEGEGGILRNNYVTADTKFESLLTNVF